MVDEYNRLRGLDSEGIPTRETLGKVGLDYVSEELEKRDSQNEEKIKVIKVEPEKNAWVANYVKPPVPPSMQTPNMGCK